MTAPAFSIDPASLAYAGSGLRRPECVLCTADGSLYAAHWDGGVSHVAADGTVAHLGLRPEPTAEGGAEPPCRPNGIALLPDGSFLLADLGQGGVWRLPPGGTPVPWLLEVDGRPLHPTNFVAVDAAGRVWVTVSTQQQPRDRAYRAGVDDGYIVLVPGTTAADAAAARIVAEGLGFTNECVLDDRGQWLYVNETFSRRTSRFPVDADGSLGAKEVVATYGAGTYPDGLAFDAEGALWLTSVVSNRVLRLLPDGSVHTVLEDADPAHVARVEAAYQAGELGRAHMDAIPSRHLKSCSSIAFGGADLCTVYLGALLDERIAWFRSPIPGRKPVHWRWGS